MRRVIWFMLSMVLVCLCWIPAFAAEVAAAAPVAPSFMDWVKANLITILGVLLAISELMATSPAFKGNGILDSIIKGIKFFTDKQQP